MPYVNVPNDLSKIKTKLAFNLTKRQLVCFGIAAAVGVPTYLLARSTIGNTGAMFLMMAVALPAFLLAMYEGLEAGFDIAANKPIFGELPRNKQMLVNAWIELHKEELMANWHAGRLSGEFFKLDPLR